MGFREKVAEARDEAIRQKRVNEEKRQDAPKANGASASFESVRLKAGRVSHGTTSGPVKGAHARVELGADVRRRMTVTRTVGLGGIGGLLFKKQAGHIFLTVEHDEYEIAVEVPAKKEADARKFAAKINTAARG